MSKLDQGQSTAVANAVVDALEDAGYSIEEAIPGLVVAILAMARASGEYEESYLDQAANILADGGVDEEEVTE